MKVTIDKFDVFSADSINCGSAGGEFGRFAPNTRADSVRLICEGGVWHVGLPFASVQFVGVGGEAETREAFERIRAAAQSDAGYDSFRWRADRAAVEADSRADAIWRHNQSCERATYRAKFGGAILA